MSKSKSGYFKQYWPWVVCGLGALFYCYEYFLRIAPSVMTVELMQAYGLHAAALGNLIAFYYYAYTPMQLLVGVLMDRFGPRRLLTFACLICALGTYLFAGQFSFWIAATGRFLVGFGSAFAFVGVLKLATLWLPPNRFAMVAGLTTSLGMIGAMVGDIALSVLVQQVGWQVTTHASSIVGVVLAVLLALFIRDHSRQVVVKVEDRLTWRQLGYGLVAVAKNHQVWLAGLIGFLIYLPTSAFAELWGVPYLEQAHHLSIEQASTAISMIFLGWALGGPLGGWVSDHYQNRRWPMIIGAIVAAALISVVLYVPQLPYFVLLGVFVLFGIFSGVEVIVFAVGRENCANNLAGTAIAVTNMLVMLGGVIFQPAIGLLLDRVWSGEILQGVHVYSAANYQCALIVLPVGLVLSVLLSLLLKETHGKLKSC